MSEKIDLNNISALVKGFAASLVAIVSLCGSLWFFGEPHLEKYVDSRIKGFLRGPEIQLFIAGIIEDEKNKAAANNSGKVKLRELLAGKMGVDTDEVHIEIGRQYVDEKEIKKELDKLKHDLTLKLDK